MGTFTMDQVDSKNKSFHNNNDHQLNLNKSENDPDVVDDSVVKSNDVF